MSERTIEADGIELATEAFGDPADPPVLLVMGVMASMLWWPDEFCRRLAARGRYVIRYDNRDTGRSTTYPPGSPGYTLDDLADDAGRVLDGYGLPAAHLVGMSLGGMIGQLTALKHPARVASLTAISTTAFDSDIHDRADADPNPNPTQAEPGASPEPELDLTDRAQAVAYQLEGSRRTAGPAHPFDEAGTRRLIERDFDRARHYPSILNHMLLTGGETWRGRLPEITAPLLVIHGTADPLFPLSEGIALAKAVGGGDVVRLEGTGHELPEAEWDQIIAEIIAHTSQTPTENRRP